MLPNIHKTTGIRFGVIALNNLDGDLVNELWTRGTNVSEQQARDDIEAEIRAELEEAVAGGDLDADDLDYQVSVQRDQRCQDMEIAEPTIEGEYDGVKYQITWLGGAPLLWALEGPTGFSRRLCSICVPNAADLDSGFIVGEQHLGGDDVHEFECYVVPNDWLSK